MTMNDAQRLITSLMRTIDRKTLLSLEADESGSGDKIVVRLSQGGRRGMLLITNDDIVAAETDLMRRNLIRGALKRAHDKMWHEEGYVFSTKMPVHKVEPGGGWGRGGGGRR